tara:strand:- start:410 stop:658 length:249 start_codon:yes stop_codon:yes gene_type:complete
MIISYFAWLKEKTGKSNEIINKQNINDINKLIEYLSKKYPKLKKYLKQKDLIRFSVNSEYVTNNKKLKNKDEIGIFPPVSGG